MKKLNYLALLIIITGQNTWAQDFLENWDLSVSAGYGQRTNPLLNAKDIETYINLDIAWYGERFFFDNGDIGYNFIYTDNLSLNLVGQINNERVFFGKTNTQLVSIGDISSPGVVSEGQVPPSDGSPVEEEEEEEPEPEPVEYEVADRNYAYEVGIEAILDGDWGQLQLSLLQDVSGQHGGQRVEANLSRTYIEGRWLILPSLGIAWKSDALADYYFGVQADESNDVVPEYQASASLNPYARLLVNYALQKDLFWGLALDYEKIGSSIADSPIITQDHVLTAYAGIKYRF